MILKVAYLETPVKNQSEAISGISSSREFFAEKSFLVTRLKLGKNAKLMKIVTIGQILFAYLS